MGRLSDHHLQGPHTVDHHPVFFLFHPTPEEEERLCSLLDEPGHPAELEKNNYYFPWPASRTHDGSDKDVEDIARRIKEIHWGSAISVDRQSLRDGRALIIEIDLRE